MDHPVQARIDAGDRIDMTNHCCVFEDFSATPHGGANELSKAFNRLFRQTTLSLEDLSGRGRERQRGDLYYLQGRDSIPLKT